MRRYLIKAFIISAVGLYLSSGMVDAQSKKLAIGGVTYLVTQKFMLEITRKADNKKFRLGENSGDREGSFYGLGYLYETSLGKSSRFTMFFRQLNRYKNVKAFSTDQRNTDFNESMMQLGMGYRHVIKKVWGFFPSAAMNMTYASIGAKVRRLQSVTDTENETGVPPIDDKFSTSSLFFSFAVAADYHFRYAGFRMSMEIFPYPMETGDKINDNYSYSYIYEGYQLGIGFFAIF